MEAAGGSGGSWVMFCRAVATIELVASAPSPLPLSTLARRTSTPKTTMYRLLQVLVGHDLVARAGNGYVLGDQMRRLGRLAIDRMPTDVRQLLMPYALELYEGTGDLVCLGTLDGDVVSVVAQIRGHRHQAMPAIAERLPAHCCAMGKLLLAQRTGIVVSDKDSLVPCTPHTITDVVTLSAELRSIRRSGIAFADQECVPGVMEVALPIVGRYGVVAALARMLPAERGFTASAESVHRQVALVASAAIRRNQGRIPAPRGARPVPDPGLSRGRASRWR